jgi:hypothetical protein
VTPAFAGAGKHRDDNRVRFVRGRTLVMFSGHLAVGSDQ